MLESTAIHLLIIAAVALGAHVSTLVSQAGRRRMLVSRLHSEAKVRTVTAFTTGMIVFAISFAAVGFVSWELGVPLAPHLASASVIGLAVSFGPQGVAQDVIMGLTVVFSDLPQATQR